MKITNINFKKIFVIYIIIAIMAGIGSVGFLAYQFKDKIIFAHEYNKMSEKVEKNKNGIEAVKSTLTTLANQSADIVDILVLDRENKITFSAKHSELAKNGNLELAGSTDKENRFLNDQMNPNIYFRIVEMID